MKCELFDVRLNVKLLADISIVSRSGSDVVWSNEEFDVWLNRMSAFFSFWMKYDFEQNGKNERYDQKKGFQKTQKNKMDDKDALL